MTETANAEGAVNPRSPAPSEDSYRALMQNEWADIHHSRIQEWSALGVVTGAHIALTPLLRLLGEAGVPTPTSIMAVIGCLFALAFTTIGALVTCRHRRLMYIKLNWIYDAETKLRLIKSEDNPVGIIPEAARFAGNSTWKGLMWPRPLSTSGLLLLFYLLFVAFDLMCIGLFVVGGGS